MTDAERSELINFIITSDQSYDYSSVNFNFYSDEELLALRTRIIKGMGSTRPSDSSEAVPSQSNTEGGGQPVN